MMFKKLVLETIENETNTLDEGIGDYAKAALLGGALAFGQPNPANAKTIDANIHMNHPVTSRYESGERGYGAFTKDNYGGYSYGKDQISTKRGKKNEPSPFDYFMKFLKDNNSVFYTVLNDVGGWNAAYKGDKMFIETWQAAAMDPKFQKIYDEFLRQREVLPVLKRMDNSKDKVLDKITSWASKNNAVQAAVKSTIIQHGKNGGWKLIRSAARTNPKTESDFIKALYAIRARVYHQYSSRYKNELKDVLALLNSDKAKIN